MRSVAGEVLCCGGNLLCFGNRANTRASFPIVVLSQTSARPLPHILQGGAYYRHLGRPGPKQAQDVSGANRQACKGLQIRSRADIIIRN
jgi:hypothetical protein